MSLGNVFIVDDEEIIVNPLNRMLRRMFSREKLDYKVIASLSGVEALEVLSHLDHEPPLIISDIMMEEMKGDEFLYHVREKYPDTLLIVLTGFTDSKTFNELNEKIDLFSYMEKPFDNFQLQRAVKNALNLFRRKKLLSRYVPEEIVEKVLMQPNNDVLNGVELEATILFFDFRNSTSLFAGEDMGPQEVFRHLNEYFTDIIKVLDKYNGVLDKFMGDGLMALFGVPYPIQSSKNDAQNAVLAALEIRDIVHRLNAHYPNFPLTMGIGISTGLVYAGNIGSPTRMNYTVLGKAVNYGKNLEVLAKPHQDAILISAKTYEYVSEVVETRPYSSPRKDKYNAPSSIYELINKK